MINLKGFKVKGHSAIAMPDGIYVLGGHNGFETLNTLYKYPNSPFNTFRYAFQSKTWHSTLSPMNTPRSYFSAVSSSNFNYIYVMGGSTTSSTDSINHVERYDVMRNVWEQLAPMKTRRWMHAACITNM